MKKVISLAGFLVLVSLLSQATARAQQGRNASPALALPGGAAPSPACVAGLLGEYVNWLKQSSPNAPHVVMVTAVSNQKNQLVSYAEGALTITGSPFPAGPGQPAPTGPYTLGGTLTQYFSDRKYGLPGNGVAVPIYPFAPQKTDQLGLSISTTGQVSLTLKSYGNKNIDLVGVDFSAGVLYGLTNTAPNQSFYVISFSKGTQYSPAIIK